MCCHGIIVSFCLFSDVLFLPPCENNFEMSKFVEPPWWESFIVLGPNKKVKLERRRWRACHGRVLNWWRYMSIEILFYTSPLSHSSEAKLAPHNFISSSEKLYLLALFVAKHNFFHWLRWDMDVLFSFFACWVEVTGSHYVSVLLRWNLVWL